MALHGYMEDKRLFDWYKLLFVYDWNEGSVCTVQFKGMPKPLGGMETTTKFQVKEADKGSNPTNMEFKFITKKGPIENINLDNCLLKSDGSAEWWLRGGEKG